MCTPVSTHQLSAQPITNTMNCHGQCHGQGHGQGQWTRPDIETILNHVVIPAGKGNAAIHCCPRSRAAAGRKRAGCIDLARPMKPVKSVNAPALDCQSRGCRVPIAMTAEMSSTTRTSAYTLPCLWRCLTRTPWDIPTSLTPILIAGNRLLVGPQDVFCEKDHNKLCCTKVYRHLCYNGESRTTVVLVSYKGTATTPRYTSVAIQASLYNGQHKQQQK